MGQNWTGTVGLLWILISSGQVFAENAASTLHMQLTSVNQEHGPFRSPYEGQASLSPTFDSQTSLTWTFFYGRKLWRGAELYINPELSGGGGFDKTNGIAAFPNGEIYRVEDPSPKWNFERIYLKQVFGLDDSATEAVEDGPNQIATEKVPVKRLTVILGKFAMNDFFDNNRYSHDPRTQFLNWALMDQGSWDYSSDTRGYSYGFLIELNQPAWAVRLALVQSPIAANSYQMDPDLQDAYSVNLETETRYQISAHPGVARLLLYQNHARMGSYAETINTPADAMDITKSRAKGRIKSGIGLNLEQALSPTLGGFLRAGLDDGATESWAFTEIDRSFSVGLSLKGAAWSRIEDTVGLALIVDGLSPVHKSYLERGGYGFIIGDGQLNYGLEKIGELYYSYQWDKHFSLSGDYQYVQNPAYNQDRGPVSILSMRIHVEI